MKLRKFYWVAIILLVLVLTVIYFFPLIINFPYKTFPYKDGIPYEYNSGEYSIGGLKPGSSDKEVIKVLGQPQYKNLEGELGPEWYYPGITLTLWGLDEIDYVMKITITSDRYQTYRGIKVGDPFDKVKKEYQKVWNPYGDYGNRYWFFDWKTLIMCELHNYIGVERYYIDFDNSNGKVSKIYYSSINN